jgi:hypothetical protein
MVQSLMPLRAREREMAETNRYIAESLEAESRDLERLRDVAEEFDEKKKMVILSFQGAMAATLIQTQEVSKQWGQLVEILQNGCSLEESNQILRNLRALADNLLCHFEKNRVQWQIAVNLGISPNGMEQLNVAEQEVRRVKTAIDETHGFLVGPRPPIDLARLQNGRNDMAAGDFKSPEEMRSHVEGPRV